MIRACGLCRWIGHRFEARFEQVALPSMSSLAALMGEVAQEAIDAELNVDLRIDTSRRAYVRDVCVRCGATVERGDMGIPISEQDQTVSDRDEDGLERAAAICDERAELAHQKSRLRRGEGRIGDADFWNTLACEAEGCAEAIRDERVAPSAPVAGSGQRREGQGGR